MKPSVNYQLYLCTDRNLMSTATVEESVELAIQGGVTVVQLREKQLSSRDFYETAVRVKSITDHYQVPLIINDRLDIAQAVGASGVHLGQSDLPCREARRILGPNAIIGVSARTVPLARKAVQDGADYLGVGAMCTTSTKSDAVVISKEQLAQIRAAVSIPMVIIGGINAHTAMNYAGMGIDGIAVVSAIVSQPDIRTAAARLREMLKDF